MKLFVVWDSHIPQAKSALQTLQADWGERGHEVEVLGLTGNQGAIWSLVEAAILRADHVLALLDHANANVGFEIGYALGKGRPVALASLYEKPAWCERAPPLDQQLIQPGIIDPDVADLLLERLTGERSSAQAWQRGGRAPAGLAATSTRLLCPTDGIGKVFARRIKAPWEPPPTHGWTLDQLGELLDGVGRVVWIIPQPRAEADRDGPETARLAVLAGFAHAHGVVLKALTQEGGRQVLDVFPHREPFADAEALVTIIRRLEKEGVRGALDPLDAWRLQVHAETRRLTPFHVELKERDLPDVFVPLEVGGRHGRIALRTLLEGGGRWALIAEPGAGKTTVLRQLAHELAGEDGVIGLYVPLYALARSTLDPFALVEEATGPAGLAERLRREAAKGRVWLLLDGLDEVDGPHMRPMRSRLEAWARDPRWGHIPMVVSARPVAVERQPLAGFTEVRLEALEPERQHELLHKLIPDAAEAVLAEVRRRRMLSALIANPLMATLVAFTAQRALAEGGRVPVSRVEVYAQAVTMLLECHHSPGRAELGGRRVRSVDVAREALQRLSWRLITVGGEVWKQGVLEAALLAECVADRDFGAQVEVLWGPPGEKGTPHDLLEDVSANSGIIGRYDGLLGDWRYMHRSLKEYLAASEVVRRGDEAMNAWEAAWEADEAGEQWGEAYGLMCALAPDKAAWLRRLAGRSAELIVRALKSIDGLDPELVLGLMWDLPDHAWNGDDLAEALSLCGATARARVALWARVLAGASDDRIGRLWDVLEQLGMPPEREAFFRACGRELPTWRPLTVRIPAGSFWMGSPDGAGRGDEHPQHRVTVSRPFDLGVTVVTNAEYRRFRPGHGKGEPPDHPAVNLTWYEARLYAAWLGGRLPTEAAWEYACRAGTTTAFSFGDEEAGLGEHAWFGGNSDGKLRPVGQKQPNPWGLHDMHGLVWEWCADGLRPYTDTPADDPEGPRRGGRCLRGGYFLNPADWCRSAYRGWGGPWRSNVGLGFRVLFPAPADGPLTLSG